MSTFLPGQKSRTVRVGDDVHFRTRPNGLSPWGPYSTLPRTRTETILSQCHTGAWPPPVGSTEDIGGPMTLHRVWNHSSVTHVILSGLTEGRIGMVQMLGYTYGLSPADEATSGVLNAFGTSAIARVLPTNPNSSLSTALAELKQEGLPRLPGSSMRDQVDLARKSGDEFLNLEFGWLPLVNDVKSFADSVRRSRQIIDQYVRDSDQKIRRRYTPEALVSNSTFVGTGLAHGQNIQCPGSSVSKKTSTQFSFSGAFRYHVPVDSEFLGRLRRYEALSARLFDTRITPELVWNLAPWSWAIDWFTNTGDVIHNISRLGSDGLVMQYGYAMRHMRVAEIHGGSYDFTDSVGRQQGYVERSIGSEWKQRVKAHPYGFGIDDTSLTAIQAAILAALGLTRGQRPG